MESNIDFADELYRTVQRLRAREPIPRALKASGETIRMLELILPTCPEPSHFESLWGLPLQRDESIPFGQCEPIYKT